MSIYLAGLKKINVVNRKKVKTKEELEKLSTPIAEKWVSELNKFPFIGKILNWAIVVSIINIVLLGIFVILTL